MFFLFSILKDRKTIAVSDRFMVYDTGKNSDVFFYDFIGWYLASYPNTTGWKMENLLNQPTWPLFSPN